MNENLEAALRRLAEKFDEGELFDLAYGSEGYDSPDGVSDELAGLIATIKEALPAKLN